jgi:hypothetical protein
MSLPIVFLVFLLHKEAEIVDKAGKKLLLLSRTAHNPQEVARHILTGFIAFATLE